MIKRLILLFVLVFFFSGFNLVYASVIINEVQLSPTENRFIELYNNGSEAIDLTNWYIQRKTQTGASFGSLISKTNFENKKISAKGYFLISRLQLEKSDIVLGSLTLTESNTIQIKNGNGEVLDTICWGDVVDCVGLNTYNPNEGQSIQRNESGSLVVGSPTPGLQNFVSSVSAPQNNNISSTPNVSGLSSPILSTVETKTKIVEIPKIKTKITAKSIGFTDTPLSLGAVALGLSGEQLNYGKYFWNFGDGDSKEINLNDNRPFSHTYFYPGDYVISLDYYQNYYSNIPDASDKVIIKVVEADVSISRVGDEKDFFVELFNNTNYDADISGWILASNQKSFSLPRNTILQSKKTMIISLKITNFSILDKDTLKLMTQQGQIIFDYGASAIEQNITTENKVVVVNSSVQTKAVLAENVVVNENIIDEVIIDKPIESLPSVSSPFIPFIAFLFIGVSASGVYFIRRKRVVSVPGDDFEILDE